MGRPPKVQTETPEPEHIPQIAILERRLADPDSVNVGSGFIPLKDDPDGKKWKERWGNYAQQGRYSELKRKGWVPVRREELVNFDAIPDLIDKGDGYVWRGEKGKECLLKIPLQMWTRIKVKEAQVRDARTKSKSFMRGAMAEAAAKKYGDQGGEAVLKMVGDIRELPTERVSVEAVQEAANVEEG